MNKLITQVKHSIDLSFYHDRRKRMRFYGLIVILSVAFLTSTLSSFYLLNTGDYFQYTPARRAISHLNSIVKQSSVIGLLIYILSLQGRSLSDIGFSIDPKDLKRSVILLFKGKFFELLCVLSIFLCAVVLSDSISYSEEGIQHFLNGMTIPDSIDFIKGGITTLAVASMTINPFFEELIVRGFLMTEVEYIFGNMNLAIILSVLVQVSYHYYQGAFVPLIISVSFTVYSFYFANKKRIMPIILAHLYLDLIALIANNV